jgi:hypothetical protein
MGEDKRVRNRHEEAGLKAGPTLHLNIMKLLKLPLLLAILSWTAAPFWAPAPFWIDKPPVEWTDAELVSLITDSPWAQMVPAPAGADAPGMQLYLATAAPLDQAERERERRYRIRHPKTGEQAGDALVEEYRIWLAENRATQIVLAIGTGQAGAFSNEQETRQMEQECVMRIGRKKYKMTGHFPPSAGDPYLRLAFPRVATAADKTVTFDLYVPGVSMGARSAEFTIKDMIVKGKLEM